MPKEFDKEKILFIAGPTAVGKTAVGISLAKKLNGEIVSCDSMQVYKDVRITSNKPSLKELDEVAQHMIDIVSLTQDFNVVQFEKIARICIEDILDRKKIPIIVGGTGMYMKSLIDGIFGGGDIPEDIHQQVLQEIDKKGSHDVHELLKSLDPEAAKKIHPNDERRIVRALEVYRSTGIPISQWQQDTKGFGDTHNILMFGLAMDRSVLYDRINKRVGQMFDQGLIEEVRSIERVELSRTARVIIGVKEVRGYLLGECSLEEAKEEMMKNTRHLAKRQLTWFRAQQQLQWINILEDETADCIAEKILKQAGGISHVG